MNTTKFTFGMLNVVASSLLVANLHFLKAPVPGISSGTFTAKEPQKEKETVKPAFYMDKFTVIFPNKEEPQPDLFKKKGDVITFNTNPTPGVVFRIQVLATKDRVPLFSERFNGLDNIKEEYKNGLYKYTVGEFRKPTDSEHEFYVLENKGYHDTYLVAYKDDKRINLKDAITTLHSR